MSCYWFYLVTAASTGGRKFRSKRIQTSQRNTTPNVVLEVLNLGCGSLLHVQKCGSVHWTGTGKGSKLCNKRGLIQAPSSIAHMLQVLSWKINFQVS